MTEQLYEPPWLRRFKSVRIKTVTVKWMSLPMRGVAQKPRVFCHLLTGRL
jgi:hypothetical protein